MIHLHGALVALALIVTPTFAHNGKIAIARPMTPVTVDGDLSDWPTGLTEHVIEPWLVAQRPADASDMTATMRLGLDSEHAMLYGAVRVVDESIVVREGAPEELAQLQWDEEDGLEIYVGVDHDSHFPSGQFGLRGNRVVKTLPATGPYQADWQFIEISAHRGDRYHTYEFSIDLTGFGLTAPLTADTVLPFDLAVVDRDADGSGHWAPWGPHALKFLWATLVGDVLLSPSSALSEQAILSLGRAIEAGSIETARRQRDTNASRFLMVGVITIAALLHFLLFAFRPVGRVHLHYAVFAGLLASLLYFSVRMMEVQVFLGFESSGGIFIFNFGVSATALASLRFLYSLFSDRLPRRFWILPIVFALWVVLQGIYLIGRLDILPRLDYQLITFGIVGLACAEASRVIFTALKRRQRGARIVLAAFAPAILFIFAGLMQGDIYALLNNAMYASVWLVLAMSAHLAMNVARTQNELEDQLVQVRDLTARTLRQNRQIEEATRNKSEFLRRMSHDLRSPMNAIIGYTRLLRRRLADRVDEREARNLSNIETSSGNLLNLINDILDLSRIEAGHVEMNLQPVDMKRLADECADALESIVKEGVVLHRDLTDVGAINSDPDRLRQIVMNLLGNATKFTEAGSITLSLKRVSGGLPSTDSSSAAPIGNDLAAGSDKQLVEISITDTGIGIPALDLPHIFDEFRQVERQGGEGAEGTGLGLAIAKKTVELLGGEISATSEVGVGTAFTVRFPA